MGFCARGREETSIDRRQFSKQVDIGQVRFVVAHEGAGGGQNSRPKLLRDAIVSPRTFLDDAHHHILRGPKTIEVALSGEHRFRTVRDSDGVGNANIAETFPKQQLEFLRRGRTDAPEEGKRPSGAEASYLEPQHPAGLHVFNETREFLSAAGINGVAQLAEALQVNVRMISQNDLCEIAGV